MLRQADCGTGTLGRVRGGHFEDGVQEIINRTSWRPADELGRIRGRTLRIDGESLTDIDALGTKGDSLLLVSCKGRVHDASIEIGEYEPTRNVQTLARESVSHWTKVIAKLRSHPRGDNFDFSGYTKIIGVVCFTFPIFLADLALSHRLSARNLRTLVTLEELHTWLQTEP
jgi:hypothetical protein